MATLLIDGNCFFEMHIIKNWDKCDGEMLLVWVDFVASIAWFYSYCWIYCNFFENLSVYFVDWQKTSTVAKVTHECTIAHSTRISLWNLHMISTMSWFKQKRRIKERKRLLKKMVVLVVVSFSSCVDCLTTTRMRSNTMHAWNVLTTKPMNIHRSMSI